jgi:hypothetical protein
MRPYDVRAIRCTSRFAAGSPGSSTSATGNAEVAYFAEVGIDSKWRRQAALVGQQRKRRIDDVEMRVKDRLHCRRTSL